MKKLFSLMFAAILILAGCGSSDDGELSGTITVGIDGNPVEIATYQTLGEKFTEETGVEVEFRQYTDFNTEIQAELIGGTAPDVFTVPALNFPTLVSQGVLAPINTDMLDMDQYEQNLLDPYMYDDTLYAIPKDYSTLAIYYNTDYVNKEDLPTSYEELGSYLSDLSETLPDGMVPMTFNIDLARELYLAQMSGDQVVDPETGLANLTAPGIVENLAIEYDLAQEGLLATPQDLGVGSNGEAFGSQKAAIMLEGNWVAADLNTNYPDVNYEVAENFTVDGNKGSMLFNVGWAVNAASDMSEEAQAYVQFMENKENTTYSTEQNGTLPARTDVANELGLDKDPVYGPHVAAVEYATAWQGGTSMPTINGEFQNYLPSVVTGERTLEEALNEAETQANLIIEENNK